MLKSAMDAYVAKFTKNVRPEFCTRKFGADVRREGRRCISILQALSNETDAPKSRDRLFRRTSAFLQDAFITRWVSALADQPPAEKGKVVQKITCTLCLLIKHDRNADVRA